MPLSPGQLLMMRRSGPGMAPGASPGGGMGGRAPVPGGAPPGSPGEGGGDIGQAIQKLLGELQGGAQGDYVTKVVENMKRTAAVMVAKLDMSHPEVARHMARAWSSLDAALKASKQAEDGKKAASAANGPLGFSGAAMGSGQEPQGPQMGGAGAIG